MEYRFDLASEEWMTCRSVDGSLRRLGLSETLRQAHELVSVEDQNPLAVLGVYRILIALLHRIVDGPRSGKEWKQRFAEQRMRPNEVERYFKRWHDRFDLFGTDHPFYQTAGLTLVDGQGASRPVRVDAIQHPATVNLTVFEHRNAGRPLGIPPSDAAKALIAWQLYGFGGLNKKTANLFGYQQSFFHGPLVGGIATILAGQTLFDTLWLNALVIQANEPMPEEDLSRNKPPWELEAERRQGACKPAGYLDYLVPYSRHIRLIPESEGGQAVVKWLHIAQGAKYVRVRDPMHHERQDHKDPERWYPPALRPDRALWRESSSLFAFTQMAGSNPTSDHRPMAFLQFERLELAERSDARISTVRCASFALSNLKANPLLWRHEMLSFPARLLEDVQLVAELVDGLSRAEHIGSGLSWVAKTYTREVLGVKPDEKEVTRLAEATGASAAYWDAVEAPFRRWLPSIGHEESRIAFFRAVRQAAEKAFRGCIESRQSGADRYYRGVVIAQRALRGILMRHIPELHQEVKV